MRWESTHKSGFAVFDLYHTSDGIAVNTKNKQTKPMQENYNYVNYVHSNCVTYPNIISCVSSDS